MFGYLVFEQIAWPRDIKPTMNLLFPMGFYYLSVEINFDRELIEIWLYAYFNQLLAIRTTLKSKYWKGV